MAAAQLLHQIICFPTPPSHPNGTPSLPLCPFLFPTQAFLFSNCVVFVSLQSFVGGSATDGCRGHWCNFKVFIDMQSPHDVGSCCQRSQPVGVPVWLGRGSHLDPCWQVTVGLWKQQDKQNFWASAHPSSAPSDCITQACKRRHSQVSKLLEAGSAGGPAVNHFVSEFVFVFKGNPRTCHTGSRRISFKKF